MGKPVLLFGLVLLLGIAVAGCFSAEPDAISGDGTSFPSSAGATAGATTAPVIAVTTAVQAAPSGTGALRAEPGLRTIARMTGGSGVVRQNIMVPASYWELWYSVDPRATGGQDSHSATGSQSVFFPKISIQVAEAGTGSVIETVEPPGGLDRALWQSFDPRPWSTKFYRGNAEYTFTVTGRYIESFTLEVRVRE